MPSETYLCPGTFLSSKISLVPGLSGAPFPRSQNLSKEGSNVPCSQQLVFQTTNVLPPYKNKPLPFFKSSFFRASYLTAIFSVFLSLHHGNTGCQLRFLALHLCLFTTHIVGVKYQPPWPPLHLQSVSAQTTTSALLSHSWLSRPRSSPPPSAVPLAFVFPLFLPNQLKFLHTLLPVFWTALQNPTRDCSNCLTFRFMLLEAPLADSINMAESHFLSPE